MPVPESDSRQPEDTSPGHAWSVRLRTNMTPVGGNADLVERSSDGEVREYDVKPHEPEGDKGPE